jgi:hypothetical protein
MPVRYVSIFENGFVVLDAERGLARMSVLAAAAKANANIYRSPFLHARRQYRTL